MVVNGGDGGDAGGDGGEAGDHDGDNGGDNVYECDFKFFDPKAFPNWLLAKRC